LEIIIDCLYLNKTPFFIDNKNGLSAFQKGNIKKKKEINALTWQRIFSEAIGRQTSMTVPLLF